ncbi:MAG: helix-turn-helix domain-containing protein [Oscillospiraceae bacterium]
MNMTMWMILPGAVLFAALAALLVSLLVLAVRALRKYLRSEETRQEAREVRRSLAAVLRDQRQRCGMTQEFVAESLGVSRQAVSKWENGSSDPSTANLLALAKLYGVSAEELLRRMQA